MHEDEDEDLRPGGEREREKGLKGFLGEGGGRWV